MPETITDRDVVRALRPFVRATGPLLDTLRDVNLRIERGEAVGLIGSRRACEDVPPRNTKHISLNVCSPKVTRC